MMIAQIRLGYQSVKESVTSSRLLFVIADAEKFYLVSKQSHNEG